MEGKEGKDCCPRHAASGILLFLFGLTFLLGHLGVLNASVTGVVWPVLVMLGGLKMLCTGGGKCCAGK